MQQKTISQFVGFSDSAAIRFDKKVNDFVQTVDVLDIQYSVRESFNDHGVRDGAIYTAFVVYREGFPQRTLRYEKDRADDLQLQQELRRG